MPRKTPALAAAMAIAAPALALATPSAAHQPAQAAAWFPQAAQSYDTVEHRRDRYRDRDRYYGNRYDRGYYGEPVYRDTRVWRGRDGRTYCRRKDGTTGLIVGGAAGALLGREIAGRGDRTLGAILGAAGGALLGREIDRGGTRCR